MSIIQFSKNNFNNIFRVIVRETNPRKLNITVIKTN